MGVVVGTLPVVLEVLAFLSFVVGGKGITCRQNTRRQKTNTHKI